MSDTTSPRPPSTRRSVSWAFSPIFSAVPSLSSLIGKNHACLCLRNDENSFSPSSLCLRIGRKYALHAAARIALRLDAAAEYRLTGGKIDGELFAAHHVLALFQHDIARHHDDARCNRIDSVLAGCRAR